MLNILWRNMKWRFENPISIIITIIQPLIWLLLYSTIANQTMKDLNISNYTSFILPGIIVLVIFSSCSSSGYINFIMKSSGSFYRILIAPVKRSSIILGQMLEAVLLSFFEIIILCLVSLFFSVKIASGLYGIVMMILLIFLTSFFMSGLSYFISLNLPNEAIYETVMSMIILPIFFLSSALFPTNKLSGTIKFLVNINPFTHVIDAIRKILFNTDIMIQNFIPTILLLLAMCFLSYLIAMQKLKQELRQ